MTLEGIYLFELYISYDNIITESYSTIKLSLDNDLKRKRIKSLYIYI